MCLNFLLYKVKIGKNLLAVFVKIINSILNEISKSSSTLKQSLWLILFFQTNCVYSGGLPADNECHFLPEFYF